jgi:2-keto-4-pentenoate hydratase/acetyl esterase/lipase
MKTTLPFSLHSASSRSPCAPAQDYKRGRSFVRFSLGALLALAVLSVEAQVAPLPNVTVQPAEVINLWPGSAPGETGNIGPEHVLPNRPRPFDQITNVTVPTLAVFQPSPEKRTGTGMLVIPGGGLDRLAIEHEGYEVAEWLNERGITAFLLKHRVPARSREQRWKAGLQDAQRAMSLIRSRAEAWKVDTDAIGSIGFSAGAEINIMLSVYQQPDDRQYEPLDAADTFSTRPDFNIAIYGGGFADWRNNVLRDDVATRIDDQTPPMFIVHAFDDQAVSSIILMNALKRANVVSELHIFGAGAHGFGVRDTGLPVGNWREQCFAWLDWQGYLDTPAVRSYAKTLMHATESKMPTWPRLGAVEEGDDLASAFASQRRLVRHAIKQGAEIAGYKGAYTSASAQTSMGLREALHGVLFKAGRLEAASQPTLTLAPNRPLLVEAEIGFVMATDIGTKLRLPRQAMTTVEALVPVVELPIDAAPLMGGKITARDAVASNVGSGQFIVGSPVAPSSVKNIDDLAVSISRDGKLFHTAKGGDVKGGQAETLMTLINQIIDQGHVIHRGDIIICGALGGAKPGEKGRYHVDYGELGVIAFQLD